MQGSDRIKTEFGHFCVCELWNTKVLGAGQKGGYGWTLTGLAHGLNSGDWLGDLSEPDMGAMCSLGGVCRAWGMGLMCYF